MCYYYITYESSFPLPKSSGYAPKRAEEKSQATSPRQQQQQQQLQLCNVVVERPNNNQPNDLQPEIIQTTRSQRSRSNYIERPIPEAVIITARDLVLQRCRQSEPISFEKCFDNSTLQHCQKIGEGVYGEVFLYRNPYAGGGTTVMKIIPIEGDRIVNGERQKKFEEILSEIIISMELSNLRRKKKNHTSAFPEVQKVQCVQGVYPERLLDMWDLYAEVKGTENDCPDIFDETQLYIVLELANAGTDLEAFVFNNAKQAFSMFQQVACALAVAESEYRFEHRDLHWGNVLIANLDGDTNTPVNFCIDGRNIQVESAGIKATIIDFTLSRMEYDGVVIFNDLSQDPDLFTAEGDYQFEIYRKMQQKNGNNWHTFEPYSNILWLHYILDKAINGLRYKNRKSKVHAEYLNKLIEYKDIILELDDAKSFVLSVFT